MNFEAPEFRRRTTSARSHAAAREENDTDRKPSRDIKRSDPDLRPRRAVVGRDLCRHARVDRSQHGRSAARPSRHHRLLGRDADDDDHLAARPAVPATHAGHQALLRRRLHLPIADLDRVRLRLLLEGARKPRRSLALRRKRRVAGAEFSARRLDAPRAAAGRRWCN